MTDDSDHEAAMAAASYDLLNQAEAALSLQQGGLDADILANLQTLASNHPDIGGSGAGEVAAELMLLTEQMLAAGRFDRDPVAVFLQAWRLLQSTAAEGEAKVALIRGLKTLRGRYETAEAA
jgi:hypothetical protein